jgi:gliding motility-associated-like protein
MAAVIPAKASHIAGGEMTYKYLRDSAGYHCYLVSLTIYQDCQNGVPESIATDNPAYFGLYEAAAPYLFVRADSAQYSTSVVVPQITNSPCGYAAIANGCTLKKNFLMHYALRNNISGYTVVYQRCCRNAALTNISFPGNVGITLYCSIPPTPNTSAVFNNPIVQNIPIGRPFQLDLSAADADGDSLSYEFCSALQGATESDIKPWPPTPPPYTNVNYSNSFTPENPIICAAPPQLDPVTGMFTGTASQIGLYLVSIACHEWRGGVMINTIRKEIELSVESIATTDYKPNAGGNLTLMVGETYQFHAAGAKEYTWSPATYLDNTIIPNPVGRFPDAGVFTYTLHGVSDSGCIGDDVIHINVIEASTYVVPNAFSPNGDCINDFLAPISVGNNDLFDFRIFNRLGNKVFQASDLSNARWDGKYRGKMQDMGVYVWELQFYDNNNQTRLLKGNVTLIR